jgi:hypothetical protein
VTAANLERLPRLLPVLARVLHCCAEAERAARAGTGEMETDEDEDAATTDGGGATDGDDSSDDSDTSDDESSSSSTSSESSESPRVSRRFNESAMQ